MRLALLTIGQSPRHDIISDVGYLLEGVDYIERGVLDDFPESYIREVLAPKPGEEFYITRLRNGSQVKVSKRFVDERMKDLVREVEGYADLIVILCTGDFNLESAKPLLLPSKLTMEVVKALSPSRLGVLVPGRGQEGMVYERWSKVASDVKVLAWSPYTEGMGKLKPIAEELRDRDLIILDCIGYSTNHGRIVKGITGRPVLVPRYLVLSIAVSMIKPNTT